MAKRKREGNTPRQVPAILREKIEEPLGIVLGTPSEVQQLVETVPLTQPPVCYQMDLYPAERIQAELGEKVTIVTAPDLWDLPASFQTLLYLPARSGERELKIDMVDQAFHVLRPGGKLIVWSPYRMDEFFPALLKKVFGKVHSYFVEGDTVLLCHRSGERPRRRHEVAFRARVLGGEPRNFISRPGVFSYGRFDDGARALLEAAVVRPGERVLDLGCGVGTNGVFAAQRAGAEGFITFVDGSLRATALAELNARANGLTAFDVFTTAHLVGPPEASYDVVLANPPYYSLGGIARMFVERGQAMLKRAGRFYVVTKQPNEMATLLAEFFRGDITAEERRGYFILAV